MTAICSGAVSALFSNSCCSITGLALMPGCKEIEVSLTGKVVESLIVVTIIRLIIIGAKDIKTWYRASCRGLFKVFPST